MGTDDFCPVKNSGQIKKRIIPSMTRKYGQRNRKLQTDLFIIVCKHTDKGVISGASMGWILKKIIFLS